MWYKLQRRLALRVAELTEHRHRAADQRAVVRVIRPLAPVVEALRHLRRRQGTHRRGAGAGGAPAPAGFTGVPVVDTGGTIFPGLIELHNHLSYNALPPWSNLRQAQPLRQPRRDLVAVRRQTVRDVAPPAPRGGADLTALAEASGP